MFLNDVPIQVALKEHGSDTEQNKCKKNNQANINLLQILYIIISVYVSWKSQVQKIQKIG